MTRDESTEGVNLVLSHDEALVLFEWLSAKDHTDALVEVAGSKPELVALWALQCLLEKELAEPLMPNYRDLVEAARKRIVDS